MHLSHTDGLSAFWSKSTYGVFWSESEWSPCTPATDVIFRPSSSSPQLSEIKRLCSPLCTAPLSTGPHTISALSLWISCLSFFVAVSNLSVSLPPGASLFIYAHSPSVCLSGLFSFLYWSPPPLSFCLRSEEIRHHTLATARTGNSVDAFKLICAQTDSLLLVQLS